MRIRLSLGALTLGALALLGAPLFFLAGGETIPIHVGQRLADFTLPDCKGQPVSLTGFVDKKALVLLFIGTECPINNAYMPRLVELHKIYAPQGVQFLAINANQQDTLQRVAEHAEQNHLPFPVLKDVGNVVADQFAAQRTPEAFVLDSQRMVCYRGRIDDQIGIGIRRAKPTRRDLAIALDEVLAGKPVSQPTTPVAGCLVARVVQARSEGSITYSKQISRILQNHCQECHRPGEIGPMALLNYEDTLAWSETIKEVLQDNRMPPWYADPRYGHFANDRRLSAEDRATLLTWLEQGTPKGDDKDLPPPRRFVKGWNIGQPDIVFKMQEEYAVPADMPKYGIPYQRFVVKTNFQEDRWVQRAEARAGATPVVHHIVVFCVPPGEDFFPGNPKTPVLCGTAPGDMPLILPPGTARRIPAGSELIFEMHYTPNGVAQKDRSSVGLIFATEPPKYSMETIPVGEPRFKIPPGHDNYQVEQWFKFRHDGWILNFMPHMHLRGKDFAYEAVSADGKTRETLLSVPRYNFSWQSVYRLAEPHFMPQGSKVHCVAHFDNSAKNPNNPDPSMAVTWGDQTWEEMMIGWMDVTYEVKGRDGSR